MHMTVPAQEQKIGQEARKGEEFAAFAEWTMITNKQTTCVVRVRAMSDEFGFGFDLG
jgi:hypothetical protein